MQKVYYLSTCSTSKRIIKELKLKEAGFEFQDIKFETITESQLDAMHQMSGSYESIFSKIARKYKELNLKNKVLSEIDYRTFILNEYTFLKRPVIIIHDSIFIGSSKKVVEAAANKLTKQK